MKPWLKTYTARTTHTKVLRLAAQLKVPAQLALGCMDTLYSKVADDYEDGTFDDIGQMQVGEWAVTGTDLDPLEFYQAAKYVRLIDEGPKRVHDWLDYYLPYLQNKYRGPKGKERLAAILAKWEGLRLKDRIAKEPRKRRKEKDERKAPSEPVTDGTRLCEVTSDDSVVRHVGILRDEPAELYAGRVGTTPTKNGEGEPGQKVRTKTSQQLIVERFVELKGLSFSTRAAQKVIFRNNGNAAKELDDLTRGDARLALFFLDLSHEALTEQLAKMSKDKGEDISYKNLAALVKQWPEFGSAWENMLDAERAKHLEPYGAMVERLQAKRSVNDDKATTGKAAKELSRREGGDGTSGAV